MSSNAQLDRFWTEFKAHEPSAKLGGIDADKPGYHEKRADIIARGDLDDYSISQVAADQRGSSYVASAIDITLPDGPNSKMTLYTGRLRTAALDRDQRLYVRGGPTLREYIGTTNGTSVECYVFTGGVPLGVGSDSGFDSGRSTSHLWHIHLSWIRQHAQDWAALDGVLSVMLGESLTSWQARTEGQDMALTSQQDKELGYTDGRVEAMANGTDTVRADHPYGAGRPVWIVPAIKDLGAKLDAIALTLAAMSDPDETQLPDLMGALREIDNRAELRAEAEIRRDQQAAVERAELRALLAELDAGTLTQDELVSRIRVSIEMTEPDNDGQ